MLERRSYKQNNVFVPGASSLLGKVVDFRAEIENQSREIPKRLNIEGLEQEDILPFPKHF